jgi:hypothetical protein
MAALAASEGMQGSTNPSGRIEAVSERYFVVGGAFRLNTWYKPLHIVVSHRGDDLFARQFLMVQNIFNKSCEAVRAVKVCTFHNRCQKDATNLRLIQLSQDGLNDMTKISVSLIPAPG